MGLVALFLLSLVLGIAGLMQASRKKVLAVLGIAISFSVLAAAGTIFAILFLIAH